MSIKDVQIGLKDPEIGTMETYTGIYVNPLDLKPSDIRIEDIAHHLSLICRFGGACDSFYSVAEHCVNISYILSNAHLSIYGLLDDASEAYTGDVIRPIKYQLYNVFSQIEERAYKAILEAMDLRQPDRATTEAIKRADNEMLATEAAQLMKSKGNGWNGLPEPSNLKLDCYTPKVAESRFLDRFYYLRKMLSKMR